MRIKKTKKNEEETIAKKYSKMKNQKSRRQGWETVLIKLDSETCWRFVDRKKNKKKVAIAKN